MHKTIQSACLVKKSVVKDTSKPLIVTSCGFYRVDSGPTIKTNRPKGRRDYQLLYIY